MKNILNVARRVITQLKGDPRFLSLTLIAPTIVVYFLKLFMDTMPDGFPVARYAIPIVSFVVFFLSFLLCSIVLVQERMVGTLDRCFVNGVRKVEIIAGYVLGYTILSCLVSAIVLAQSVYLFELEYNLHQLFLLFIIMCMLSIISVLFGIFASTFARTEGHIFPIIPIVILPSVFLTGLLMDADLLPRVAQWIGRFSPLYYSNNLIYEVIRPDGTLVGVYENIWYLLGFGIILLFVSSWILRDVD
ncbi:MAG: ABC-2 type transporter [candidate division TM6 bacterium GW2011_GWF2_32_72]|nr:MAG: ABC-2 type transporter [candidate division TM6 bacterium GW2011_GWF2_32_72]